MTRFLLALLLVVALTAGAGEMLLPRAMERAAVEAMARFLEPEKPVSVSLRSRPSLKMVLGLWDEITVEYQAISTGQMMLDHVKLSVENVSVNMAELLLKGNLRVIKRGPVASEIVISESNLNQWLWSKADLLDSPYMTVKSEEAVFTGLLKFGPMRMKLRAKGRFQAMGSTGVGFKVEDIDLEDYSLPASVREGILLAVGANEPMVDLGRLPLPSEVLEVRMEDGALVILAAEIGSTR